MGVFKYSLKVKNKYVKYFSLLNEKGVFETNSTDIAGNLQKYGYEVEKTLNVMPLISGYIKRRRLFVVVKNPDVDFELKRKGLSRSVIIVKAKRR